MHNIILARCNYRQYLSGTTVLTLRVTTTDDTLVELRVTTTDDTSVEPQYSHFGLQLPTIPRWNHSTHTSGYNYRQYLGGTTVLTLTLRDKCIQ